MSQTHVICTQCNVEHCCRDHPDDGPDYIGCMCGADVLVISGRKYELDGDTPHACSGIHWFTAACAIPPFPEEPEPVEEPLPKGVPGCFMPDCGRPLIRPTEKGGRCANGHYTLRLADGNWPVMIDEEGEDPQPKKRRPNWRVVPV